MTEEFTIQCDNCGTIYPDTDEVCPYCGQPQPLPEIYSDELPPEPELEEELYLDQEDVLTDDESLSQPSDLSLEEEYPYPADEPPVDEYPEEAYPQDEFLTEDDIFTIAGEETGEDEYGQYGEYDDHDDQVEEYYGYDEYDEEDEFELEEALEPHHFTWRRLLLGCLGAFVCVGTLYGGIGLIAAYNGLQERALAVQTEAEQHFQRGQEHLANNSIELAIAEFELALSLNPNLHAAREALHEAQRISQSQPTPTSETRSAAAASFLEEAKGQLAQEDWFEAVQTLSQVRDIDPDYQAEQVSELLYEANYRLGLQLITPDRIDEALLSFERALAERPDDLSAATERTKASLYIDGKVAAEQGEVQSAVEAFGQLYQQDTNYLDAKQRLFDAYEQFGDELAADEAWCLAETQYIEAALLQPDDALQAKADESHKRCQQTVARTTGTPPQRQSPLPASGTSTSNEANAPGPTVAVTVTATLTASTAPGSGSILFSAYNPNETRWEILSVPAGGGPPKMLVANGTMPAVSPNGRLLLYHSELIDAEGFHRFDLVSGEDERITALKRHILPRWGGDNNQFLFVAQEPATGRWQIQLGFADGKSEPVILRDGRTPDWSPDNSLIAYQGTDPQGNEPGLYLVPFNGGETTRLTNHESDRAPDFSPDGSQLAYMSTRNGNWDIYTVSVAGSAPRQITTSPGNDGLPVWSPDGRQIAYVSDADGSWAIYVISAEGGTPFKVTGWDGSDRPDWLLAQIWWGR